MHISIDFSEAYSIPASLAFPVPLSSAGNLTLADRGRLIGPHSSIFGPDPKCLLMQGQETGLMKCMLRLRTGLIFIVCLCFSRLSE